jgi:hypothetical protein
MYTETKTCQHERVKVAVRDISKIPSNKMFEMEQGFFLIDFMVQEMIEEVGN